MIELHEKNRVQQQEIERLRELVKESHEREKFARDAALSQKTRMETIISSLQANIINMEHRMTKNSVENSKIAKEMTGNLELDLVRQKLVSKSLYEQVEILKTRQEFEKKKVTSLLKKQAAICIGVQETATNLDWENKKLKKYFEMLANSA